MCGINKFSVGSEAGKFYFMCTPQSPLYIQYKNILKTNCESIDKNPQFIFHLGGTSELILFELYTLRFGFKV